MASWKLVDTQPGEHGFKDAIRDLFDGDGTVYLVTGFFTENAYRLFRDDIVAFLERSPDNALVVIANPSMDQFSAGVIRDLRRLNVPGEVTLLKYPYGFLHAKLYLRDGPEPMAVMGSANLTRGSFDYNLELGVTVRGESDDIEPFRAWLDELVELSVPIRRRDQFLPMRLGATIVNWGNKGRLLPARQVFTRLTPILLVIIAFFLASWIG